jgi:hypothetical protein
MDNYEKQMWEHAFNIVRDGEKLDKAELKIARMLIRRFFDPDFQFRLPPKRLLDEYGGVHEHDIDDEISLIHRSCGKVYVFENENDYGTVSLNVLPYPVPELPKHIASIEKQTHIFQAIKTMGDKALGWCRIYVIDEELYDREVDSFVQKGIMSDTELEHEKQMVAHLLGRRPEPSEEDLEQKKSEEYTRLAWLHKNDRSDGWHESASSFLYDESSFVYEE